MSDDLISRQAAEIAFIEKGQQSHRYHWGEIWELNGEEIRDVLNSLPSVQPKEKTGHWEIAIGYDIERTVMCDQCRKMAYEPSNYCPYCGARMAKDNKE